MLVRRGVPKAGAVFVNRKARTRSTFLKRSTTMSSYKHSFIRGAAPLSVGACTDSRNVSRNKTNRRNFGEDGVVDGTIRYSALPTSPALYRRSSMYMRPVG